MTTLFLPTFRPATSQLNALAAVARPSKSSSLYSCPKGAMAVEFALSLSCILGLILGISDLGIRLFHRSVIVHVVNETLLEATRQPEWSVQGFDFDRAVRAKFQSLMHSHLGSNIGDAVVSKIAVSCNQEEGVSVQITANWSGRCLSCGLFHFPSVLTATGMGTLETPTKSLVDELCA